MGGKLSEKVEILLGGIIREGIPIEKFSERGILVGWEVFGGEFP